MGKRKVLSFFGLLIGLAIVLSFFAGSSLGTISGRVISGDSYSESLFFGESYDFGFSPDSLEVVDGRLFLRGTIFEKGNGNHNLNVKVYLLDTEDRIAQEHSEDIFLANKDKISYRTSFDLQGNYRVKQLIIYLDDGFSMVRGDYYLGQTSITGRVVSNVSGNVYSSTLISLLLAFFACLVVFKIFGKHKKEIELVDSLDSKRSRRFIDLDIR